MTKNKHHRFFLAAFFILAACSTQKNSDTSLQTQPTQDAQTPDTLTICLGQEPKSLFLYGVKSTAEQDVLQAIYDGPIDQADGQSIPVIIENIPNLQDGSAFRTPVKINSGDIVIDTSSKTVEMRPGVQFFPSGCTDPSCISIWDGESPILMDQITASFKIKAGITWSDGYPVTAEDSVYSFLVATNPDIPANKQLINQTLSYFAFDSLTVKWISKPGLITETFENYFWTPLPEHAWSKLTTTELLTNETVNHTPLGWGAYKVTEWVDGQLIQLKKNPYYFRVNEGLPYFDTLIFKIINPQGDTALSNLKFDREPYAQFKYDVGEFEQEINENGCDLITTTSEMRDQLPVLRILQNYFKDPAVKVFNSADTESELLVFNSRKNSDETPNPLDNLDLRKAVTMCLDREFVIKQLSNDIYKLPKGVVLEKKTPNLDPDDTLVFDPILGSDLLEKAGWKNFDNKTTTPRIASGVGSIPDGQELSFIYLIEDVGDNLSAAELFKASLAECGIGINIKAVPTEVYWNNLHEDSIFQGNFDIAQLSWISPLINSCKFFSSEFIPTNENHFTGINFSGFKNEDVNQICKQLPLTYLGSESNSLTDKIEAIINEKIPVIPLYAYSKLLVAQKEFCDAGLVDNYENELTGIEIFEIDPDCR